ncbi:MAG TPA: SRPBCC family protein [Steroidobacteraceae bacterium]|nr:SRPBCC family protein [Steroidobacteraceae bacterium]
MASPPPVTQVIRIRAPLGKVWEALVDPQKIAQWLNGALIETTWEPGSAITFTGSLEGMTFRDKGVVVQLEPQALMQYTHWSTWSRLPDTPEHYSIITITVAPEKGGTLLAVRHENLATEEMYLHSKSHWETRLPELKKLVESSR